MKIVTFYSFKGGVGRTMSLANVAYRMARQGDRILAIDFDLEAPGLSEFPDLTLETPQGGLVDFILDYLSTGDLPEVRNYVCEVGFQDARFYLMPSGRFDNSYPEKLAKLNIGSLFSEDGRGPVLFDYLTKAIQSEFKPHYVLVDSRTGFTDSGGVCTRYLPDLVIVFLGLNRQNRVGAKQIIQSINNQEAAPKGKTVPFVFLVVTPVPTGIDEQVSMAMAEASRMLNEEILAQIPYDATVAISESIFKDEKGIGASYTNIVDLIRRWNESDIVRQLEDTRHWIDQGNKNMARLLLQKVSDIDSEDPRVLASFFRFHRLTDSTRASEYADKLKALLSHLDGQMKRELEDFYREIEVAKEIGAYKKALPSFKPPELTEIIKVIDDGTSALRAKDTEKALQCYKNALEKTNSAQFVIDRIINRLPIDSDISKARLQFKEWGDVFDKDGLSSISNILREKYEGSLKNLRGRVKRYGYHGYGFIESHQVDREIYFHISNTEDSGSWAPWYETGDEVEFDLKAVERGWEAVNVKRPQKQSRLRRW